MPETSTIERPDWMYVRDLTETTLGDFAEQVDDRSTPQVLGMSEIEFRLESEDDPSIVLGDRLVPADSTAVEAMCSFLQIPKPFYGRLQPDQRQWIATSIKDRLAGTASFMLTEDDHLTSIFESGKPPINPSRLVRAAAKSVGEDALVYDFRRSVEEFSFDCYVPEHRDKGPVVGRKVGDISLGGLTMGQDRKRNLSPYVQPWFMRLACTNGMEIQSRNPADRVDGRRCETVDEVLAELEVLAQAAFARVEGAMNAFYDLRNQRVPNPERALRALARERGLSARTMSHLEDLAPAAFAGEEVTMFDVVNLITNQANNPDLEGRYSVQRQFQVVGGDVVNDHAQRCPHCTQKVVH